jgi:hypothetical protein
MVLESTQPLTEISTGIFLGVKGGRRVRLTNLWVLQRVTEIALPFWESG